ncbi:RES family NAD+ phosphorylase [Aquimonas sp.]|jgi:hypothetical protein|uniref:RES family NAD+ phosphorylase n=1 Tax=Aquimonas sp. TaxID=1872588 RepID=UPI0037C07B54
MILCPHIPTTIPTLELTTIKKDQALFRVGINIFPANAWDSRSFPLANYRFSPLVDSTGSLIPVSYCGITPEVAILESVLRFEVSGGVVEASELAGKFLAEVVLTRDICLIPLEGPAARALGEGTAAAIGHCPASEYMKTRDWASQLLAAHPQADGILWISRQELKNSALMIWKRDSEETAPLKVTAQVSFDDLRAQAQFQRLAALVNVRVI